MGGGGSIGGGGGGGGGAGASAGVSNFRVSSQSRAGRAGMREFSDADYSLIMGSVRGFRWYSLTAPDLRQNPFGNLNDLWKNSDSRWLRGQQSFEWQSGINTARCMNDDTHVPPVEWDEKTGAECGCGFWAYWQPNQHEMSGGRAGTLPVLGVIEGTGRIVIGTKGFRSQYAKIIAVTAACQIKPETFVPKEKLKDLEEQANAWMALIQDRLSELYPEARTFATTSGLISSYPVAKQQERE